MKIIDPSVELMSFPDTQADILLLERCGRVCYQSEGAITKTSAPEFIEKLKKNGHLSVLEHVSVTFKIVCDRGVSHELVRHRLASYSQESTRYCNYSKGKFGKEITVVRPSFYEVDWHPRETAWKRACEAAEERYFELLELGCSPQEARSVLPNSLKTTVVMTANLREWLHFCKLRTSPAAHPDMQIVAEMVLQWLNRLYPIVFSDLI